jgi:hypothetical protein
MSSVAAIPAPSPAVSLLLALDGRRRAPSREQLGRVAREVEQVTAAPVELRVAGWRGNQIALLSAEDLPSESAGRMETPVAPLATGAIAGPESALLPLLREADRRDSAVVALVSPERFDDGAAWIRGLVQPIAEEGFEFVSPAYHRHPLDGALMTGLVYPLMRALFGHRLRQPLGGEASLALPLARRLLADADWKRDPAHAGSDAWLISKVLVSRARICQSWLGPWRAPAAHTENASQAIERVLRLVFREMERHVEHWQRMSGSAAVPQLGDGSAALPPHAEPATDKLLAAFHLGERELAPIWSLVLPPKSLLGLKRAAAAPAASFRIADELWARVIYDFAVAFFIKSLSSGSLLRSMAPLYLGWVASFADEVRGMNPAEIEARVERLCEVFEREKRYLVARWRWPESFVP